MKIRFALFSLSLGILILTQSCTESPDNCQVADWVGEYTRVDGGGCSDWESRTDQTMRITLSPFANDEVVINTLPPKQVMGCELEHEFAGSVTTWKMKNGRITRESGQTGCRAVYEKS